MSADDTAPSGEGQPFLGDATPGGWVRGEAIPATDYLLLTYPDGRVCFAHTCDRPGRGVIRCAPALQLGNGHTLTRDDQDRPTVRASILCDDCGTHGWITDGRWEAA